MKDARDIAIEKIAKVCHEANRAHCQTLGDESQLTWERVPEWQRTSAINGVKFHLDGDHGPQASHENWLAEKVKDGWMFGTVKDPEKKTHPCIKPFDELPPAQQTKDYIFRNIVMAYKGQIAQPSEPKKRKTKSE